MPRKGPLSLGWSGVEAGVRGGGSPLEFAGSHSEDEGNGVDCRLEGSRVDGRRREKSQRSGMAVVLCKHGFDPFGLDSSCLARIEGR